MCVRLGEPIAQLFLLPAYVRQICPGFVVILTDSSSRVVAPFHFHCYGGNIMYIRIEKKDTNALFSTPLLQQTAFWSSVKTNLGFQPIAFDISIREKELMRRKHSSAYILDDILVLTRKVSRYESIAYVPYGPLLAPDEGAHGDFIESLSEELREKLPDDCIFIRYDLPWLSDWEEDTSADMRELRLNWGTVNHNIRASRSAQLPTHTTFVSLEGTPEEILARMKSKTRYNIRLAQRKGVQIVRGTEQDLPVFLSLYRETARRNGILEHRKEAFEALFRSQEQDARFELLIATLDGEPLSAMFLTLSEDRATYLYGASSDRLRDSMSTYALQFAAMLRAKELGAEVYDLFGIAPPDEKSHPLSGLSRFKLGFGGECIERMGCWDYPFDKEKSENFFIEEATWRGYHN